MTNSEIKEYQQKLLGAGFNPGPVDGIWGAKTQAAHEAFEASKNPPATGTMVDERSEKAIATLHPRMQPLARELVRNAAQAGIQIKITSGTRTYAEQDALYAQGRSKPGKIVTNARGGYSNHNFGVALDVTIFKDGQPVWESPAYKTVGQIGKKLGFQWGGDWTSIKDEPHFELRPDWAKNLGGTAMLAQMRARRASGQDIFVS